VAEELNGKRLQLRPQLIPSLLARADEVIE
jgi:hypothetical protein